MERIAAELDAELRGTPAALIELLPVRTYTDPGAGGGGGEQKECMVCLSEYSAGEEIKTLPCLHFFHTPCIDPWLRLHRECPLCKTAVDADESQLFFDVVPGSGGGGGSSRV